MAKQTTVMITDDLDGSANAKEVSFSLNGRTWIIDLSAKNRAALEKALKQPVVMVNLVRFRERSLDGNGSGWDAYTRYSQADMPLLKRLGGTVL